jgi:hypothetical protein
LSSSFGFQMSYRVPSKKIPLNIQDALNKGDTDVVWSQIGTEFVKLNEIFHPPENKFGGLCSIVNTLTESLTLGLDHNYFKVLQGFNNEPFVNFLIISNISSMLSIK